MTCKVVLNAMLKSMLHGYVCVQVQVQLWVGGTTIILCKGDHQDEGTLETTARRDRNFC